MKLIGALVLGLILLGGCSKSSTSGGGIKDVFFHALESEPGDIHPIRSTDGVARQIFEQNTYYGGCIVEKLLFTDLDTYAPSPNLASKWEISKDGREFTFYLRKDVEFHDGSKMTAEDVKFSFEAMFDDLYEAYSWRSFYQNFESKAQIIDPYTIKFIAKSSYYLNLDVIGGLMVFPKSFYSKQTKENRLAKTVMGSGPYKFKKWDKGKSVTVVRNDNWWGLKDKKASQKFNFKTIVYKFIKEAGLRRAMLERGKLDFDYRVRPEDLIKKMTKKPWGESVLAIKAKNKVPKNMGFIGLNNKNKILSDRRVRLALAHLVNRDFINKKFYYGLRDKSTGPFRYQGDYSNPNVKPIPYSPETAKKMLADAGWIDSDKNGLLDKVLDGEKTELSFELMNPNKDTEKIITVIKEDMKKAGVEMRINTLDWNAFRKATDERKFDAVIMSWGGGGVDPDPTQIWHSKSSIGVGSNFVSYSNPKVDKLIEDGIKIRDKAKRIKVFHEIHKLIAEDAPYIFYFEPKYNLYAVTSRVLRPSDSKNYSVGVQYWALPE